MRSPMDETRMRPALSLLAEDWDRRLRNVNGSHEVERDLLLETVWSEVFDGADDCLRPPD
jgi:hypothetical protein